MGSKALTMSIPQLAEALGISRNLAYQLAQQDRLPVPVIKIGQKRMCVSRRAVENLLLPAEPQANPEREGVSCESAS